MPKPSEECFGEWIVEDMTAIRSIYHAVFTEFWTTTMEDYEVAWYKTGDLMFKNEDECHFKNVLLDLSTYCHISTDETDPKAQGNCATGKVLANVQANAFNLITQSSGLAALFKQDDWPMMETEDKAYAFQQFGRTVGQIFVDLTGFKATVNY